MRSTAVFFMACSLSWAARSLQLGAGVSGVVVLPETAPFMRNDQANASMQFEFRLNGISAPGGNRVVWQTSGQNFFCSVSNTSDLTCTDWFDTMDDNNSGVSIAGRTDIVVRVVRDISRLQFWTE